MESVAGCSGTLNFNDVSTCTVTNKDVQPQLTVIKTVVNNSGGSAVSSDFTMLVNGTNVSSTSFAGSGAGTTVTLNQGSYGVTENGPPGYLATMVSCTGQIFVGDHVTCTITNDDIGPKIKVIKNTIGGNANFPISISSSNGPINTSILTTGGSGGNPYAQTPVPPTPGTGDTGYLEVAAGTVTVAEDLSGLQSAPAWRFTSVSCQDDLNTPVPIAVNQGTSVILNGLQLAHNYSCTFTNTQDASIPFIKKVNGTAPTCDPNTNVCTDPVSGQTIPPFTLAQFPQGAYPPSAPLSSVSGPPFQSLSGFGNYTICEMGLPTGWSLSTGDVTVLVTMFGGATGNLTPTVSDHDTVSPSSVNRCFDITIPPGADTIEITVNNKAEGALKIVKATEGGDDTFTFTIGGGPTAFNSPISINTAVSNSTSDMTALIGNYTITETNLPAGWALKNISCTNTISTNLASGQITARVVPGVTTVCTYTDTKYGHLIVTKVTIPATDTSTPFPITATGGGSITAPASRTLTGNGSSTDYQVTPGTYTVNENVPVGWDQTGFCESVPVGAGDTVNCTITNSKRGHLIVTKVTVPATDTSTPFPITATGGGSITAPASRTLTGNGSSTDYEVTPGTYTVTENVPAGWDQTGVCQNVSVGAGETVNCTITNTLKGHLIVTKVTEPSTDTTSQFQVNATGTGAITAPAARTLTGNGGSTNYEVAGNRTYSVAETVPSGWSQVSNSCQNVLVPPGQTVNCQITNTEFGHIVVTKIVINDNGGIANSSSFTMAVTGNSASPASFPGGSGTIVNVIAGSYSVTESGPSGYAASFSTDCGGTVAAGETKTCTITNNDIQPKLIVTKIVINDNGGTATSSSFTLNVTGNGASPSSFAGNFLGTTVNLNAGSYSVTESAQTNYAASFSPGCYGTIAVGETKTCTVTNNDIRPTLLVIKQVVNNYGRTATPSDFTMNVMNNSINVASFPGGPGTPVGMNAGIYAVTETGAPGYQASFSADCSGTIGIGQTKTCVITNTALPTGLITDSGLCKYDVDTSTPTTEQFKLLLTPDVDHPGQYKLNASNPGQFYYNVFGATGTSYITLPYPFVTHGAVPIHVYSGVTFTTVNGQTCLTPGTELANSVTPVTLANYSPQQFGSTYQLNIPAGAYVNIHLDYGLKGTSPYSKGANNSAVRTGYPTILDGQPYPFSFYDGSTHTQTTYSVNVFKKDPGIAGLVLSSSTSNPVPGVTVEIYDPSNVLVQTLTTDVDGWFMWQFKYTGKATTFTVKLPAYNLSQPVTLKSNDFAVVNFLIP